MEIMPKAYEKEFMRMAMLKHEETFKQQVHELHRLYRTQKTLMSNIDKSCKKNERNSEIKDTRNEICFRQIYHQDAQNDHRSIHKTKLDLEQPAEDQDEAEANKRVSWTINESEIELTLAPPSSINTSDSGITYSSSSTGSSHEGKHIDTEQVKGQEMEILEVIKTSSGYQNKRNMRENKRLDYPPWLFQVVSLNMT